MLFKNNVWMEGKRRDDEQIGRKTVSLRFSYFLSTLNGELNAPICPGAPCAIRPPTKRANLIFLFPVKFQCPDGDFFHLKKSVEILMIWSLPVSNEPLLMTNGLFIFCVKIKMPGWSALQWHMNKTNLSRELFSMQAQTKRMNYLDCILWSIFGATDIHS